MGTFPPGPHRHHGDRLRSTFGDVPLMAGSIVVAIIGFVGVAPGFTTTVLAFALVGFGTAVLIPCIFALAAAELPGARVAGIATVATIAGLPRVLAPWVFGLIAAQASMSFAFGLTTVLLLIALAFVIVLGQRPPAH